MTADEAYAIRGFLDLCREAGIERDTTRYLWSGLKDEVFPSLRAAAYDQLCRDLAGAE